MSEEVHIHGGVVRVTDANVIGNTRFNRIKAENTLRDMSVHFRTDGIDAPGPREALLVAILTGVRPAWLKNVASDDCQEKMIIDFQAVSAVEHGLSDPSRAKTFDVFRMSTVEHNSALKRLRLTMGNENDSVVHAHTELSKGQVTQMIASLLVLYGQLRED